MSVEEEKQYIEELREKYLHQFLKINESEFYIKHIYGRYVGHQYLTFFCGRDKDGNYIEEYIEEMNI